MKSLVLILITSYQMVLSPLLKQVLGVKAMCRYSPSCSAYAKESVRKHGVLKGLVLAGKRLAQCQPFAKAYGNI